ncbi:MAG: hypothetical protein JNG84_03895 [Archangium sp.]|nr:hypothetical protein [Archangium sp.]
MSRALLVCSCCVIAACKTTSPPQSTSRVVGPRERPVRLVVPPTASGTKLPLLVLLHGYGSNSEQINQAWHATATALAKGFVLALPEGTPDSQGRKFWNATPACCDRENRGIDDVAYLSAVLDAIEAEVPIDTSRVYFAGHSNGSFMSFRMGCERATRVTAIAGLAGADFPSAETCVPSRPVSVLHAHGTRDDVIRYEGAPTAYPSAREAALRWAGRGGCDVAQPTAGAAMDLDRSVPGAETRVERWATGCSAGVDVELWTLEGSSHGPPFNDDWMPKVSDWLLRHRRPRP